MEQALLPQGLGAGWMEMSGCQVAWLAGRRVCARVCVCVRALVGEDRRDARVLGLVLMEGSPPPGDSSLPPPLLQRLTNTQTVRRLMAGGCWSMWREAAL